MTIIVSEVIFSIKMPVYKVENAIRIGQRVAFGVVGEPITKAKIRTETHQDDAGELQYKIAIVDGDRLSVANGWGGTYGDPFETRIGSSINRSSARGSLRYSREEKATGKIILFGKIARFRA